MMKKRAGSLLFILIALSLLSPAYADILGELWESQRDVKTVKASFSQEKHTELLDRPIKSEGTLAIRSGSGVRWEYEGEMVVIYDGADLYFYYTELEEAEKLKGASGFMGPLVFDIDLLTRDYEVEASRSEGCYLLVLHPKKEMPFQTMEMQYAQGKPFPEEVKIREETGDTTVITFTDVRINAGVPEELFVLRLPPGVPLRERDMR
jgi:outer membrane lipoprotein-sorting protein